MFRGIRVWARRRRTPEVVHVRVDVGAGSRAELEKWLAAAVADLRGRGRI